MPDLQHAQAAERALERWAAAVVAPEGTHHLLDGQLMYAARFAAVQKFHPPGLAPARDGTGAFHIDPLGRPAYAARFVQSWGFYEGLAAVQDESGWCHIRPDGTSLSSARFAWCGNFQERRCPVRDLAGRYFHIEPGGSPAYPERHLYAGDFREGAAVVRRAQDGLCGHIDAAGRPVHGAAFLDLDVFHKGLARARDEHGWFHIDRGGRAAYEARFAAVEPFYNGAALCQLQSGESALIRPDGAIVLRLSSGIGPGSRHLPPRKVVIIGNIAAGKTTLGRTLSGMLGWPLVSIDECRCRFGDRTPAGELAAWADFTRSAAGGRSAVMEFSGSGAMTYLVEKALRDSGGRVLALWVMSPPEVCLARCAGRSWTTPYPDFGVPIGTVVADLGARLHWELGSQDSWRGFPLRRLDGLRSVSEVFDAASAAIRAWLQEAPA